MPKPSEDEQGEIERFTPRVEELFDPEAVMRRDPNGEYVRYTDLLTALHARSEAAEAHILHALRERLLSDEAVEAAAKAAHRRSLRGKSNYEDATTGTQEGFRDFARFVISAALDTLRDQSNTGREGE